MIVESSVHNQSIWLFHFDITVRQWTSDDFDVPTVDMEWLG